jgi:nucleoside-diphosphate-sugar epimerase
VRDYCYVEDVADAIARAGAGRGAATGADARRVYNLGSGQGTSVAALAGMALAAAGREPAVRDDPVRGRARRTDILCLIADPGRAERELGWRAATPLSEGLRRTVTWLQQSGGA